MIARNQKSKILSAVVTHQILEYARNSIESLQEFARWSDLIVIDNASTNPELLGYFRELEETSTVRVIYNDTNDPMSKVGSLYDGYNIAVDVAFTEGYDYLQLVVDDSQCLWMPDQLPTLLTKIFTKHQNTFNVSNAFPKQIILDTPNRLENDENTRSYRSLMYGCGASGFFAVDRLRDLDWKFGPTERIHNQVAIDAGMSMYHLADPTMAYVPWAAARRSGKTIGKIRQRRNKYYLKPLSEAQIRHMVERDYANEIPWHEDYCFPWDYAALTPYWFTVPKRYYAILALAQWPGIAIGWETRGWSERRWYQKLPVVGSLLGPHDPSLITLARAIGVGFIWYALVIFLRRLIGRGWSFLKWLRGRLGIR